MVETKLLNLDQRSLIKDYFSRFPPEVSEHTFTNLFAWQRSRPIYYSLIADSLLLFLNTVDAGHNQKILFGQPVGNLSLSSAIDILRDDIVGAVRPTADSVAD